MLMGYFVLKKYLEIIDIFSGELFLRLFENNCKVRLAQWIGKKEYQKKRRRRRKKNTKMQVMSFIVYWWDYSFSNYLG